MKALLQKTERHESKLDGKGSFWYFFFKGEDLISYRSCVYERFRNFQKWQSLIGKTNVWIDNLVVWRGKIIDADSSPVLLPDTKGGVTVPF